MNTRTWIVGAAVAAASACAFAAPVAYEGVLSPSVPVTGQVGGFSWFLDIGTGVDYWQFAGEAGQTVSFTVDRLNANLDPGLSFYSGITSADTSQFSANGNWGGLAFIGSLDDERPPAMTPGLGGDPSGSFVLASSATTRWSSAAATARTRERIRTDSPWRWQHPFPSLPSGRSWRSGSPVCAGGADVEAEDLPRLRASRPS